MIIIICNRKVKEITLKHKLHSNAKQQTTSL